MSDDLKLSACLQYLRRTYYLPATQLWDLPKLKAIATAAYAEASEQVTIVATASDLGSTTGQVTFDKWLLIAAVEQLLLEVDPDNTPAPPSRGYIPDYSCLRTST